MTLADAWQQDHQRISRWLGLCLEALGRGELRQAACFFRAFADQFEHRQNLEEGQLAGEFAREHPDLAARLGQDQHRLRLLINELEHSLQLGQAPPHFSERLDCLRSALERHYVEISQPVSNYLSDLAVVRRLVLDVLDG